jgi:periplasmic iron binding protein
MRPASTARTSNYISYKLTCAKGVAVNIRMITAAVLGSASAVITLSQALAGEFYVGEPVEKDDMQLSPAYLTGIAMDRMPPGMAMTPGAPHFEIDIHATDRETHGFPPDAWIPYLTVTATIEKPGSDYKETKQLYAMTAADGPHYANNFTMAGDGDYKITYVIEPPSSNGFIRHVDSATGVPEWWQPITLTWNFHYPSVAK